LSTLAISYRLHYFLLRSFKLAQDEFTDNHDFSQLQMRMMQHRRTLSGTALADFDGIWGIDTATGSFTDNVKSLYGSYLTTYSVGSSMIVEPRKGMRKLFGDSAADKYIEEQMSAENRSRAARALVKELAKVCLIASFKLSAN
jgi:hypothetical protein